MTSILIALILFPSLDDSSSDSSANVGLKYQIAEYLSQKDNIFSAELEVTDEQRSKLSKFLDEYPYSQFDQRRRRIRDLDQKALFTEYTGRRIEDAFQDILLDHQIQRFQQMVLQIDRVNAREFMDGFSHALVFADVLGLSDEEVDNLQKRIDVKRREYYEEEEKLKRKAIENILKSVPEEQREMIREGLGEPFDFHAANGFYDLKKEREKDKEKANEEK